MIGSGLQKAPSVYGEARYPECVLITLLFYSLFSLVPIVARELDKHSPVRKTRA